MSRRMIRSTVLALLVAGWLGSAAHASSTLSAHLASRDGPRAQAFQQLDGTPPPNLAAPTIQIVDPANGSTITRRAAAWTADPKTAAPVSAGIRYRVTWPAGQARGWQQADCIVDGLVVDTQVQPKVAGSGLAAGNTLPPAAASQTGTCNWNISGLGTGGHWLIVAITDDLGLVYRSSPAQVYINILTPARTAQAPAAGSPAAPFWPEDGANLVVMAALAGAAIALGLTVFEMFRNPSRLRSVTEIIANEVKESTEVILGLHRRFRKNEKHRERAQLVRVNADGTDGSLIPIAAQSVYLGRDPARVQIVFSDLSVSRLHCRIVEEADGVFMIYDEGGTSGTYVNDERVATGQGCRLERGDLIDLGRIELRFEPGARREAARPVVLDDAASGERTEVFQRQAPPSLRVGENPPSLGDAGQ